ncbi:catechol 2,3-dioxygenase-like lactoylglutathione lyase family enzyme [Rhizobium sp. PP-F2F-G48]|uniref:VOC family protein n=1 Tax=Rhizobium sp. PP-F2F-G48 TaxID=2135651 RepID=UPI001049C866|nr:VOC family protein [Rhizobium sp. PP-F2F-G48]TCM56287.1 catechol 2,3-dioxygenase-like lactoylglutathione lyase family enzyme [Rhizobium sp. PP-F2F-G48]
MAQTIARITLVVLDYDDAIAFYRDDIGFELLEDVDLGDGKRWVVLRPPGAQETALLIAKADGVSQVAAIGNQTGGRVSFFLFTDDFARDHAAMLAKGVTFKEEPRHEPYGTVAVFSDPFGNLWDLLQPTNG